MGSVWPPPRAGDSFKLPGPEQEADDAWTRAELVARIVCDRNLRRSCRLIALRGGGPLQEHWLRTLGARFGNVVRVPSNVTAEGLNGDVDIEASILAGRRVNGAGLIDRARDGLLLVGASDLASAALAAITGALDREVPVTVIALDADELPPTLNERVSAIVDLHTLSWIAESGPDAFAGPNFGHSSNTAAPALAEVAIPDAIATAILEATARMGGGGMCTPLSIVGLAKAVAGLEGRRAVSLKDALMALRLRFAISQPSAHTPDQTEAERDPAPSAPDEAPDRPNKQTGPTEEHDMGADSSDGDVPPFENVVEAISSLLATSLADFGKTAANGTGGSADAGARVASPRGRPIGTSVRPPYPGARLDVPATLRAAAPWQGLRTKRNGALVSIRPSDFRYVRRRDDAGTTVLFVVDASGSAATERMAEAKGAVEKLLAEAYARRDEVALIAFRGGRAELVLPATRGLSVVRRRLGALPGGGGTPLASAIMLARDEVWKIGRGGRSALTVFLTDGRGNVALDGRTGREATKGDQERAARMFATDGGQALVIDTALRAGRHAKTLADRLGARFVALPRGDANGIARTVADAVGQP